MGRPSKIDAAGMGGDVKDLATNGWSLRQISAELAKRDVNISHQQIKAYLDKAGSVVRKVTGERRCRVARDGDAAYWEAECRSLMRELRDIMRNEQSHPQLRSKCAELAAAMGMQGRDAGMDSELMRMEAG